jgi:hypothetical protein
MKKVIIIVGAVLFVAAAGFLTYWFVFRKRLADQIVVPYIAHQKPRIDPHVPAADPMSDKLDEVIFDGLFNVAATPSGIAYEDGLGEYMGIDQNNVVSVRLKPNKKWHESYAVALEKTKVTITEKQAVNFVAKDLKFTLRRIQSLGSLSPDFILVVQAVQDFDFTGPDENDEVKLQFKGDRVWTEPDIKEVLSFKILPSNSELNAPEYKNGTGPYMSAGEYEDEIFYVRCPSGSAQITNFLLKPYIDNSTFTTELRNGNINVLLTTPFGSISPILADSTDYFVKSNISTCFFALLYNTKRLSLEQRIELRKLIYSKAVIERFFKVGTQQQRHVVDYKGNRDNYDDYLNYSVFPTSSYYVEEQVVTPLKVSEAADFSKLPDTVRIQTCLNYGYREELSELVAILNDPTVINGSIKATAVQNEEIARGDYDAVLVPFSGYRSNFLFDLYDIFLREPDFESHKINLVTGNDPSSGKEVVDDRSFDANKNFFRLDLSGDTPDRDRVRKLLEYVHGFMATHEIGDKQAYAQRIDELDQQIALGSWLFSLPSLAYFSTQFDQKSIDLYGVASQLSTIEKWREGGKR